MIDTASLPRGIRNNNPGNIRRCRTLWQGEAPAAAQTDAEFLVFAEPVWGLRAIARILLSYQRRGLTTVRQAITRWAPPQDPAEKIQNDTEAYIAAVASEIGVGADAPLDFAGRPLQLQFAVEAIVRHENGQQPYPQDLIARACALAH